MTPTSWGQCQGSSLENAQHGTSHTESRRKLCQVPRACHHLQRRNSSGPAGRRPGAGLGRSQRGGGEAGSLTPSANEPPDIFSSASHPLQPRVLFQHFFLDTDVLSTKNFNRNRQTRSNLALVSFPRNAPQPCAFWAPHLVGHVPGKGRQAGSGLGTNTLGKCTAGRSSSPPGGPSALPSAEDAHPSTAQGRPTNPTAFGKTERCQHYFAG